MEQVTLSKFVFSIEDIELREHTHKIISVLEDESIPMPSSILLYTHLLEVRFVWGEYTSVQLYKGPDWLFGGYPMKNEISRRIKYMFEDYKVGAEL